MVDEDFEPREFSGDVARLDYVPLTFAKNLTEAEYIQSLLEGEDIPVIIDEDEGLASPACDDGSISVMVPEELLNDASEIIAGDECDDDEDEEADKDLKGDEIDGLIDDEDDEDDDDDDDFFDEGEDEDEDAFANPWDDDDDDDVDDDE